MTETTEQKVVRLAEQGVERAARDRRPFTITKLSRHEDGYWHARVTPRDGKPIYVHCRYGSWQAPGKQGKRDVSKDVLYHVAAELQRQVRTLEHRERQLLKEATDADNTETDAPAGDATAG